jgi:ParB-like chromosome segregation protein Spo0J|tara:strand:+ start:297 stop:875 length:579 start_codon:yes stop_codon:yes gene_type:complete
MIKKVKISEVKKNPANPRLIKDYKYSKLVKSLKDFPQMLELRPIVVDKDMVILGGNMRYRASVDAGLNEVWIKIADNLTEKQKKEFIIKDNTSFGEWDWDLLANEWNPGQINDWGLDLPKVYFEDEEEPQLDKDIFDHELDTYINAKIKQITLFFNSEEYEKAVKDLETIRQKESLTDNTQVFKFLIDKYGL